MHVLGNRRDHRQGDIGTLADATDNMIGRDACNARVAHRFGGRHISIAGKRDRLGEALAALGSERLAGCDVYVTLEPCAMCAGARSHARIRRLYYAAPDPKGGAVDHGPHVFNQPTCHHAPEVYGGIRESEAAAMLRAFFASRR